MEFCEAACVLQNIGSDRAGAMPYNIQKTGFCTRQPREANEKGRRAAGRDRSNQGAILGVSNLNHLIALDKAMRIASVPACHHSVRGERGE
jgi:hypothetical protein